MRNYSTSMGYPSCLMNSVSNAHQVSVLYPRIPGVLLCLCRVFWAFYAQGSPHCGFGSRPVLPRRCRLPPGGGHARDRPPRDRTQIQILQIQILECPVANSNPGMTRGGRLGSVARSRKMSNGCRMFLNERARPSAPMSSSTVFSRRS